MASTADHKARTRPEAIREARTNPINPPKLTPGAPTTRRQLDRELLAMGYRIASHFDYANMLNHGMAYAARSCYIIEADTGIGFANIHARRDANFDKLQSYRFNVQPVIHGRIYEL